MEKNYSGFQLREQESSHFEISLEHFALFLKKTCPLKKLFYQNPSNSVFFPKHKQPGGLPGGSAVMRLPTSTGDKASISGLGRSGNRNTNQLWHSCLGKHMDRGAWWTRVHGVIKSQGVRRYFVTKQQQQYNLEEEQHTTQAPYRLPVSH